MGSKTLVYRIHKGHGCIGQAKGHHYEFIMTISSSKCKFGDVFRVMFMLRVLDLKSN